MITKDSRRTKRGKKIVLSYNTTIIGLQSSWKYLEVVKTYEN